MYVPEKLISDSSKFRQNLRVMKHWHILLKDTPALEVFKSRLSSQIFQTVSSSGISKQETMANANAVQEVGLNDSFPIWKIFESISYHSNLPWHEKF